MRKNLLKSYKRLNILDKILLALISISIVNISLLITSLAASGITFSDYFPPDGSTISEPNPNISVTASVYEGIINNSHVKMWLDNSIVNPNVYGSSGNYNIGFNPFSLKNGPHTVKVEVYDENTYSNKSASWSFNVDAAPQFSNITPANNAAVEENYLKFNADVKDTFDNIDASSAILIINGTTVNPQFTYKVNEELDANGNTVYVTVYNEGTLSYEFPYLPERSYNAELSIADDKGNIATEQWDFDIKIPPTFSNFTPSSNSIFKDAPGVSSVSVQVYDDTGIDFDSIELYINNVQVSHTFDSNTNTITYNDNFSDGDYNIKVSVKDVNGNVATANWSFIVDFLPNLISLSPGDGAISKTASPMISAYVRDSYENINDQSVQMKVDGNTVTPEFTFKGHWETDTCNGQTYYVEESYQEGTITYQISNLTEGIHTAKLSVADVKGNNLTKEWSFKVGVPPVFSNLLPGDNSFVGKEVNISAIINDDAGVDWESVVLKMDDNIIPHSLDTTANLVYYDGFIADGIHTVTLTAKDLLGNEGSTTWNFNKDSAPPIASQWSPAKDSSVKTANPNVSVYVTDIVDELDPQTVTAKINGKTVSPNFEFKGYWKVIDTCSGSYNEYIIQSEKEGTISFSTAGLTDGVYTVEVSIADVRGNILKESWSFTVGIPPKFSNLYPANDSENPQINRVSAVITDDQTVDWNSIILKVNGKVVSHQLDTTLNTVYYEGNFSTDTYDISIDVKDISGNLSSKNWSFITDTIAPTMGPLIYSWGGQPSGSDSFINDLKITNKNFSGNLTFSASIRDSIEIRRAVVTRLEGTETKTGVIINKPLDVKITFKGDTDSCSGEYIEKYFNQGSFNFSVPIKDGEYKLSLNFADVLGNDITHTRTFTVQSAPVIKNMAPTKYGVQNFKPIISANVSDLNGNINIESIQLKLNGSIVAHNYDASTGQLTYTPTEPLSNESYHTATLTATDDQGLTTTKTWKFYVNTFLDMPDSSPSNCTICHYNGSSNPLTGNYHSGARFSGDHGTENRCNYCHKYITYPADCVQCHGFEDGTEIAPHGSTPTISYQAVNYDPNFPIRVIKNREMNDCVICHQPGMNVYKSGWAGVQPTILMTPHDIPELHKLPKSDCNNCHAQSLTREHTRVGRFDADRNTIDCLSCHSSNIPKVQNAVSTKNKYCNACHIIGKHDTLADSGLIHGSDLQTDCQTCHKIEIDREHTNNLKTKTTNGINYDCEVCHGNSSTTVQDSIYDQNTNCTACHVSNYHDMSALHSSNYVEPMNFDCTGCHSSRLDQEHYGKVSNSGSTLNCGTCHNSTDPKIKTAIDNHEINCDACHVIHNDVTTVHDSDFVLNPILDCSQCHNDILNQEHEGRISSTTGLALDCKTCHNSTDTTVKNAVSNKNTKCDACHNIHTVASIEEPHTTVDYVYSKSFDCSSCHSKVLTTEHEQKGDCNLCHGSIDSKVSESILTGQVNCDSCHVVHDDVSKVHITSLSFGCNLCHTTSLITNHGDNCSLCHDSTKVNVKNAISNNNAKCSACHDIHPNTSHESNFMKDKTFDCLGCHSDNLINEHENRKVFCDSCHKTDINKINNAVNTQNRNCDACHEVHDDITTVHETQFPDVSSIDCNSCHDNVISREHPDKMNSAGEIMTCNTCHSVDASEVVKQAIKGQDTQCKACHSDIHPKEQIIEKHESNFEKDPEFACIGCHEADLTVEHSNQQEDCNSCHTSDKKLVADVIKEKETQCKSCHTTHKDVTEAHWKFAAEAVDCQECHSVHKQASWDKKQQ